jgi:hypothetical protein
MGLDMYLNGRKHLVSWDPKKKPLMEDGFEVEAKILRLGYWRKHPNLHGYVVNTFAGGEDECQDIYLSEADLLQTLQAVRDKELPATTGFFFGESDGSEDEETLEILMKALAWLRAGKAAKDSFRSVIYRASW